MNTNAKFPGRLKKVLIWTVGIYAFYAALILLIGPEQFPLMPYGIVLGAGLAALIVYALHLWRNCQKGQYVGGTGFLFTLNHYEFLIRQLVKRDFKTKYKRSVLGIFWSFLNPLLLMAVQYVVFSYLMASQLRGGGVPFYMVYLLAGIIMFSGFQDCANQAMHSITGNASLITKVYVPKYIYPSSKVFSAGINTLLSMIPLLAVTLLNGVWPALSWLLIPVALLFLLIFTVGMGFFLSSLVVFFRDIEFLWGVFTSLWMYATPIIYPISILPPWMQKLEMVNPMYHLINFMRTILIDRMVPAPGQFLACIICGVLMMLLGTVVFHKTEEKFILYL